MHLQNDQRRPVRGSGVEMVSQQRTSQHRVSRSTVNDRKRRAVIGVVVVDLAGLDYNNDHETRMRLSVIGTCPVGAKVRIVTGKVWPIVYNFAGLRMDHVDIEVVGTDPGTVGRWVRMITEVIG